MNLARDFVNTNKNQVALTWSNGLSNNGQPVIDYRIWYDQGTGNYVILNSGVILKSFVLTTNVTPGQSYAFQIQARNVIGFSALSMPFTIIAASKPPAVTNV